MKYNKRQQKKQVKKYLSNKFNVGEKMLSEIYKALITSAPPRNIQSIHDVGKGCNRLKGLADEACLNSDQKIRPKTIEGSKLNKLINIL